MADIAPEEAFLQHLCEGLVEHPDAIVINRTIDELGTLLTLQVHKNDMGKVIGREGACASAIRTLLRSVGMKQGAKVNLKILEPLTHGQTVMREAMADVRDAVGT